MMDQPGRISLRAAALTAGLSLLVMVIAAPIAELYLYPRLIISTNAAETTRNVIENAGLLRLAVFLYLVTFFADIVAAWALYAFFKPVNPGLSLLTAWIRLVYTVVALATLLNLVTLVRHLNTESYVTLFEGDEFSRYVMLAHHAFKSGWGAGIAFFGLHLGFLGYLVLRSTYVPRLLGVLLIIAGVGYLMHGLKPFLYPGLDIHLAKYTFYGELVFMLWLLIRGGKSKRVEVGTT